jgi:hypothetical protein
MVLRWRTCQSTRLSSLKLWVWSSHRTNDTYAKRVDTLPKVEGTPVSSHCTRDVDRVGWDYPLNWPFHRSCSPWSDMSHKVAARGALRKLSTRSGWAASLVIQLRSQLQVRMISTPLACVAGPQFYGGPDLQRAGFCEGLPRRLAHLHLLT